MYSKNVISSKTKIYMRRYKYNIIKLSNFFKFFTKYINTQILIALILIVSLTN